MTQDVARAAMVEADLLLVLPPETPEGGMPGGKLYEYLAAGPPILAVPGTDQFVMQVLRDTDAGSGASDPLRLQMCLPFATKTGAETAS